MTLTAMNYSCVYLLLIRPDCKLIKYICIPT